MNKIFSIINISLFITLLFCGCGNADVNNKKADDYLSQAVYEILNDDVCYLGRIDYNNIEVYDYYIKNETQEVVQSFFEAVDKTVSEKEEKIQVKLCCYIPGGTEYVMTLKNYSDESAVKADLNGIKNVAVKYPSVSKNELFTDPEIYTGFQDVQYFTIDEILQKTADNKGIDWNKVWSGLKNLEINK